MSEPHGRGERVDETERITIVIVDDHPAFRSGLRFMLGQVSDFEVVAEAGDGLEAVERAADAQPDVMVMDLPIPAMNGIDATRRIVAASPHIGVLVVTMSEDDESVFAAMRAGARGYLLKGAGQDEIERAVRAVARGEAIFGPAVARRITDYFSSPPAVPAAVAFPELSDRERQVLALVADGNTNPQIASV